MATGSEPASTIPDEEPPAFSQAKISDLTGLQKSGVQLAWGVLTMIGVLALYLVGLVAIGEYLKPPSEVAVVQNLIQQATAQYAAASQAAASQVETLKQTNELLLRLAESKRAARDFWQGFGQFLLMNLLLPVLTSILGYVFGTSKANGQTSN